MTHSDRSVSSGRSGQAAPREAERLLDGGHFFEAPRWHDGSWWVSDQHGGRVLRVGVDGEAQLIATVEHRPCGLGWMPDGSLLIVSMDDRRLLRLWPDGELAEHADLRAHVGGNANDMVVDRHGRAYVSNVGFDFFGGGAPRPTPIVRVDPDGTVQTDGPDLLVPNGFAITPDGRTLIVAESFGARLTAFTIGEDGALRDHHIWAQLGTVPPWDALETLVETEFAPDGIALDADGHVWVADALNGRAARVAPGGAIVDEVYAPNGGLYACALGGEDGRTLLTCTAPGFDDAERAATTEGVLYTFRVDVPAA